METFHQRIRDLKQDPGKKRNGTPDDTASGGASHAAGSSNPAGPNAGTSESEDKEGTPELFGKQRVEKLFEDLSKKDNWHYLTAYEELVGFYPRIASGRPWEPWVSDSIANQALNEAKEEE